MSKELLTTDFYTLTYYESQNTLEVKWFATSDEMTHEEYKEHLTNQVKLMFENSIKYLYVDSTSFFFVITPALQQWSDETLVQEMLDGGLEKMAILLPEAVFSQISVEQLLEESEASVIEQEFFTDKEEALVWLHK